MLCAWAYLQISAYECQTSRSVKHESIWLHKAHLSSTHMWCLCLLASNIWALRSCSICSHNPLLQGHRSWKQEKPWLSALQRNEHNVTMLTWLANTRISSYLKTHSRLGVTNNEKWLFNYYFWQFRSVLITVTRMMFMAWAATRQTQATLISSGIYKELLKIIAITLSRFRWKDFSHFLC